MSGIQILRHTPGHFVMQQRKKWAHSIQRLEADAHIAELVGWQREDGYYMHDEPGSETRRAIKKHASLCQLREASTHKRASERRDVGESTGEAATKGIS